MVHDWYEDLLAQRGDQFELAAIDRSKRERYEVRPGSLGVHAQPSIPSNESWCNRRLVL